VVLHASRVLRWGALAATGIVLASCSSGISVRRAEGLVTGTASSCGTGARSVTIVVLDDLAVRTSVTIHSGAHFAFHLSPGHYVVTTGHLYSPVTLGAGATVTVNFVPACSSHAR
jgi:hypothetical protein